MIQCGHSWERMQTLTYMSSDLVMLWEKKNGGFIYFLVNHFLWCRVVVATYLMSCGEAVGKIQQGHVSFRDFLWKAVGSKPPYLVPVYVPDYV